MVVFLIGNNTMKRDKLYKVIFMISYIAVSCNNGVMANELPDNQAHELLISNVTDEGCFSNKKLSTSTDQEQRIALIISNANYENSEDRLPAYERAGKKLAETLTTLGTKEGFNVIYVADATKEQIIQAIDKFVSCISNYKNSTGLIYFLGHGLIYKGKSFLVPIDAENIGDGVSLHEIIGKLKPLEKDGKLQPINKRNLIILDACNSSSDKGETIQISENIALNNLQVFFAAMPGTFSHTDSNTGEAFFTDTLIELINIPGMSLMHLFELASRGAKEGFERAKKTSKLSNLNISNDSQTAWHQGTLDIFSDFYFVSADGRCKGWC